MKILVCGDFCPFYKEKNTKFVCLINDSVKNIFNSYDITILNLEAPVIQNVKKGIDKFGPCLSILPNTLTCFKNKYKIDYVTLANNHFYDYGDEGVTETINLLDRCKIGYVGGGRNEIEKEQPLFLNNICILNYCESEFSVDHKMGSNKLDTVKAFYNIKEAINERKIVIIIIHGGHEGYQLPSPRMKQLYRYFIDCGASVVINHHQHCYSGYEKYNNGIIFYGLGNFYFNKISPKIGNEWCEGFMVGLDIDETNNKLKDFYLYPYNQCKDSQQELVLMQGAEKDSFYKKIEILNEIIADDDQLKNSFFNFVNSKEKDYLLRFTPYTFSKFMGLYKRNLLPSLLNEKIKIRILNAMSCESHRDACIYLLRKTNNNE